MTKRLVAVILLSFSSFVACRSAMSGGLAGGVSGGTRDYACALMLRVDADLADEQGNPVDGAEVWEVEVFSLTNPPPPRAYRLGLTGPDGSLRALTCYKSTNSYRFWLTDEDPVVLRLMVVKEGFGARRLEIRPDLEAVLAAGSLMDGPPGPSVQVANPTLGRQGRWYSVPLRLTLFREAKP